MTFLNLMLLGGSVAGGIPLLIHLLRRNNPRVIRWGAMQLLQARTIEQRRRIRLEQLLLLLLRIAIPAVLALCMARPFLDWLNGDSDSSPKSVVILLDDSASMASGASAIPSFDAARAAIQKLFASLPRGSEVVVLPLSFPELPIVDRTVNLKRAAELLAKAIPQAAPARPAEALEAAAQQFYGMHHGRRQVVLCSDFQLANWLPEQAQSRDQALQRLRELPQPPHLSLYDTGVPGTENVAVEALDFSKLPVGVQQRVRFRATLRNFGIKPRADLNVRWKVDGVQQDTTTLSLAARESTQTLFEHTFTTTGPHTVEIEADHDAIPSDDSMLACINVRERIPVLIVNGRPSPEPLQGETDFLEIALHPRTNAEGEGAGLLRPSAIEPAVLDTKSLSKAQTVFLANISQLNEQQVRALEDFVERGGGLIFFPGTRTDSRWANTHLHRDGKGLLPAGMTALQSRTNAHTQMMPLDALSIAEAPGRHPILDPFNQSGSNLGDIRIHTWYSLRPADAQRPPSEQTPATVILSLENGEPLLVERRFGNGIVVQSAVSCGAAWANLPARPAFVPLMQRLAVHTGSAMQPPLNLSAGETLTANLPSEDAGKPLSLSRPDGTSFALVAREGKPFAVAEWNDTRLPGIYKLTSTGGDVRLFAVNSTREESNPERLAEGDLDALAVHCGAVLTRTPEALLTADTLTKTGREVWRPLLWATLLLLFLELILQQRFRETKGVPA